MVRCLSATSRALEVKRNDGHPRREDVAAGRSNQNQGACGDRPEVHRFARSGEGAALECRMGLLGCFNQFDVLWKAGHFHVAVLDMNIDPRSCDRNPFDSQ